MNKLERFNRLIAEIKEQNTPVIVEGKRDKKALEKFGVKNVRLIHTGSLRKLAEETKEKKVILITDYDRRGELLKEQLELLFRNEGITADLKHRKELRKLTGFVQVEELPSKYEEIKSKLKVN